MPDGFRVLVCGGRDFDDYELLKAWLDALFMRPTLIIHGDYRGADKLAQRWAQENGVEDKPFPADWNAHGRRAGPLRNARMLAEGRPHLVIAFPGMTGTADMVRQARAAGVPVVETSDLPEGCSLPRDA